VRCNACYAASPITSLLLPTGEEEEEEGEDEEEGEGEVEGVVISCHF